MFENIWRDVRFGARTLAKHKFFAAVAITTLALGIGVNTAIFSVINAVLLAPLPYDNYQDLVVIWKFNATANANQQPESIPNFLDLKEQNQVFDDIAAIRPQRLILTDMDHPESIAGARVSPSLFSLLRVKPQPGRDFLGSEDREGGSSVALISYRLWQQRYGGDSKIVGRALTADGKRFNIIGVLPKDINYPTPDTDLYVPLVFQANENLRGASFLRLIGRLKPGVSLATAKAQLKIVGDRLAEKYPAENKGTNYQLIDLQDQIVGTIRPALMMLLGAVGCVLLIACANVANLLLARAAGRRSEFAIRSAVGATRIQLMRQVITESFLLSTAGGALGLALAFAAVPALVSISASSIPRAEGIGLNLRVLGFTALISILTGSAFGLAPALRSAGSKTTAALSEGRRGTTGSVLHRRLLGGLVVSEVAIALVLLVAAGLMVRSFVSLSRVETGLKAKGVLTFGVGLPSANYSAIRKQADFYDQLVTEIRTQPGIESSAAINRLPMGGGNNSTSFTIQSKPVPPENAPNADYRAVTNAYFKTMAIPMLAGRDFSDREMHEAPDVVIINQTMVRRFFADINPIGQRLQIFPDPNRWREIVGVVDDVKLQGLDLEVNPAVYVPMSQNPYPNALRNIFVVSRTTVDPKGLILDVEHKLRTLDKEVPLSQVRTMEEIISSSLSQRRLSMTLLVLFAALAALLAMIGIYGVMAYTVTQRTHELGIRMAMGAQRHDVLRSVLVYGAKLAALGVLIGLVLAFSLTRVLATLLYGVGAFDPLTYVSISMLLIFVALLASFIPALRASHLDPLVALRNG